MIGVVALVASVCMNRNTSKKLDKIEELSQTVRDNAHDIKTQSDTLIKYTDRTVSRLFGQTDTHLRILERILPGIVPTVVQTVLEAWPDLGDEKKAEVTQKAQAAAKRALVTLYDTVADVQFETSGIKNAIERQRDIEDK